ncbi:hypothetical protein LJK88_08035 [Paenibacillus sp. P26]|nr:hypothetical protein LJK88_08035 [Paenibacillus sp. P26]
MGEFAKKPYVRPLILATQLIVFETGLSSGGPGHPGILDIRLRAEAEGRRRRFRRW